MPFVNSQLLAISTYLRPMRIGFDAKRIFNNATGLGNYSRTLVKNLAQQFPEHQYFLFSKKSTSGLFDNGLKNIQTIHPAKGSGGSWWRSFGITDDLSANSIDIYHGLSNEIPFQKTKTGAQFVVTIHDLIFKHFPHHYAFIDRSIYNIKSKYACKNADVVIAASEATKRDIIEFYDVDEKKIKVVYQSCDELFLNEDIGGDDICIKYNLPSEYILYVGSLTERKNLLNVCKAYLQMQTEKRIPCVVIGNGGSYAAMLKKFVTQNKLEKSFIFLENISNLELVAFYKKALVFIYPSVYEGFGIPLLEAMACGCPVITSNISSLPEVGGNAAHYFQPYDVNDIAQKILEVTQSSIIRHEMIKKGFDQIKIFDPAINTQKLMDIYLSLKG